MGDLGIEPSVRLREGVTVPCHTLRPVAHVKGVLKSGAGGVNRKIACGTGPARVIARAGQERRAR